MSILANINPFKKKAANHNEADKNSIKKNLEERTINPHETGGCCGGCGGLEENNK